MSSRARSHATAPALGLLPIPHDVPVVTQPRASSDVVRLVEPRRQKVSNRKLISERRHVGDQSAVTTPPQGFAAHDHHLPPWDDLKQFGKSGSKLLGSGVRRVRPERGHSPPGVDGCIACWQLPSTAEAFIPSVLDSGPWQPPLQRFTVYIGISAAARIAAYIDDHVDPGIVQQLLERDPVQRSMTDGQQWHPLIVPRTG